MTTTRDRDEAVPRFFPVLERNFELISTRSSHRRDWQRLLSRLRFGLGRDGPMPFYGLPDFDRFFGWQHLACPAKLARRDARQDLVDGNFGRRRWDVKLPSSTGHSQTKGVAVRQLYRRGIYKIRTHETPFGS
jgi:hypothetical protein